MSVRSHRYFKCRYCNHKLRFGAHQCGSCYQPTQMINRVPTWTVLGLALVVSGAAVAAGTLPSMLNASNGGAAHDPGADREARVKASL
ncbi:hypothetical protein CLG85_003385 [Yangia mangrovi]|uniref:Uncharacterized protein n=1 Tax=Alloyangia mangrovi TaxID=1779329 RepID=A0ABT2KGE0_9RHOB|nr:hypothetical protein [Alloyangia mangrovi]MCT4369436.1 hypothetical protein [Alloyangia mangrovi]